MRGRYSPCFLFFLSVCLTIQSKKNERGAKLTKATTNWRQNWLALTAHHADDGQTNFTLYFWTFGHYIHVRMLLKNSHRDLACLGDAIDFFFYIHKPRPKVAKSSQSILAENEDSTTNCACLSNKQTREYHTSECKH